MQNRQTQINDLQIPRVSFADEALIMQILGTVHGTIKNKDLITIIDKEPILIENPAGLE